MLSSSFVNWGSGCSEPPDEPGPDDPLAPDPVAELSDIVPTVARVTWEYEGAAGAYVEFGPDSSYGTVAPATLGEDDAYEAILMGMKALTEYHYRAVVDVGDETHTSSDRTIETGGLASGLPQLAVDEEYTSPERNTEGFLLTTLSPTVAVILDADGDIVWWHRPETSESGTMNRLLMSTDGESLLYHVYTTANNEGPSSDNRFAVRVDRMGEVLETIPLPDSHHDIAWLPDGTIGVLNYDRKYIDYHEVDSDRLTEVAPDGTETELWTMWDIVDYDPDLVPGEMGLRWGHCNAVRYEEAEDAYYVGCRHFSTIYRIDRQTGDVTLRFGRLDSDLEMISGLEEDWFDHQHQFRLFDDRVLVFSNGESDRLDSRVTEHVLDREAGTAELVWWYRPDPSLGVFAFGDVHRYESGNTLTNWGSSGRLEEVTPEGDIVFRLDLMLGAGYGYMEWVPSLYPTVD